MKILHVTPYYSPAYAFGGVPRAVEGMAHALKRRGHEITVLTTDALSPTERYQGERDTLQEGIRVIRVPNVIKRGMFNLSTPFTFPQYTNALSEWADVIHCHEFRTVENLLITPHATRHHKPLILSPHGTLTHSTGRSLIKQGWDALFSRTLAARFDHVVGLTQAEADESRAYWQTWNATHTQFSVVPNGINPAEFAVLPPRNAFRAQWKLGDATVCLYLARLHPRKGAHILARAFRQLNIPNTHLVIAGADEGAQALIRPFLNDNITLTGYLDAEQRLAALAAADVFVLPATGEGLSIAVLEAMAAKLPVILSPGCNLPEVVEAGAGLEVAPEPDQLADALRQLLTDPAQRAQMGNAAHHLIHERFTWDAVGAQLEQTYQSPTAALR